ncbi:hypothetical protein RJ639_003249 [Escallonia herrerae]|uniref:Outer envelope protein 61 n=1 Tax=Escallonia herrerae TaxID=1293975 RepID=A0AA88W2W8_9ASTE|nr:hypothetical protein RJ639_003249 [Escallonia herrerae]
MFNGMMDPELLRLAQDQMSRMSPAELARIQQQMMSNPELMRMASEGMQNMRPEDLKHAAEQMKYTRPEDMAEIGEKMANTTPEEIAAMRMRVDAQSTYEINAAQMLKKQGNDLHSQGRFNDALQKYLLAKKNLKGIPASKGRTLLLTCSLNLMSCYLKTRQYDECIVEGTEVLAHDARNVKALYRRGQAYKELGKLDDAISDLRKAHEVSPDDETIADVLRYGGLFVACGLGLYICLPCAWYLLYDFSRNYSFFCSNKIIGISGVVIEEITEEDTSPSEVSVSQRQDSNGRNTSQSEFTSEAPSTSSEHFQALKDDPQSLRFFQNFISQADPETLIALNGGKVEGISSDMVKTASNMISKMSPEELQKMVQMASSFQGENPSFNNLNAGSVPPEVSPDMLKSATDMMSKMSTEDMQRMFEMASSFRGKPAAAAASLQSNGLSHNGAKAQQTRKSSKVSANSVDESSSSVFLNSRSAPQSSFPSSSADLQEQMRNQMNDPAMRQMFTSMIKNMNPDMMANMSEQFGFKLSREDAEKAQQAMSSLTPDKLDKMMKWADRLQRGVEGARKTKNWLLGRWGMILAVCMLILAVFLHWLGYIGS